ncbi:ATP-dependent RNA helicase MSS116 mitochondrial precursor [Lophiotrema nucula]|uniref:ATP-dependent RNA helicase n=1 Tax=Lophiotrema nucula TaxID=690887 RepID=A0A6A5Z8M9_9PLEO|nr:ATP-dependent RNA helicase MSS116 mitochondrial precursor [Lophiotrema nucula]
MPPPPKNKPSMGRRGRQQPYRKDQPKPDAAGVAKTPAQQPRRPKALSPNAERQLNDVESTRSFTTATAEAVKTEADNEEKAFLSPRLQGPPYETMAGKLDRTLLAGVKKMGFEFMTPVQQKVLTELPTVSSDCLVQAKTGTGKTAAFLLPAIQNLLDGNRPPRGQIAILVVCPTRELALQISKEAEGITSGLKQKMECHTAYGGTGRAASLNRFLSGDPTILVATPGRLIDYLSEERVRNKFENIKTVVLDEADRMLDEGFAPDIKKILKAIPPKSDGWQGMCFSATLPDKVQDVVKGILFPGYTHLSTMDPNEVPTIDRVPQYVVTVPHIGQTFAALYALLDIESKESPLEFKTVVFGTTANGVGLLYDMFKEAFPTLKVFELHSRMSQNTRTRTTTEFKQAKSGILFASDVVGRGMDFPNVGLVVQLGLPSSSDQYIHRVGRTARAGKEGRAIMIVFQNEAFFVKVNKTLPIQPYPKDIVAELPKYEGAVEKALASTTEEARSKAYQAFLGFNKTFAKKLQLDMKNLVRVANEYSEAMGLPEPPMLEKRTVGKMGLKGVPGLRVGSRG